MSRVARYGRLAARPGKGAELGELLVAAGDALAEVAGCELYLVSRQADDPDVVWVTELWRSRDDLDASLRDIAGSEQVAAAMALVAEPRMIELDLLGGKGPLAHPLAT